MVFLFCCAVFNRSSVVVVVLAVCVLSRERISFLFFLFSFGVILSGFVRFFFFLSSLLRFGDATAADDDDDRPSWTRPRAVGVLPLRRIGTGGREKDFEAYNKGERRSMGERTYVRYGEDRERDPNCSTFLFPSLLSSFLSSTTFRALFGYFFFPRGSSVLARSQFFY